MVRRGQATGSIVVVSAGAVASGRVFIALSQAAFSCREIDLKDRTLAVGDALISDRSTLVEFHTGVVCAIEVAP